MRELTPQEIEFVSGGEYLDYFTLETLKNLLKINIKPTKVFEGKFEASMFTFPTPEQIEENLRLWQAEQGNNPPPQPSAPPIMPGGSGGGSGTWDHHVQLF